MDPEPETEPESGPQRYAIAGGSSCLSRVITLTEPSIPPADDFGACGRTLARPLTCNRCLWRSLNTAGYLFWRGVGRIIVFLAGGVCRLAC